MEKLLYIFRHGQSTYNLAGRTQGQTNDSVLTELGKQQAENIGKKLKDKQIDIIVCSPLTRAKQTADIANKELQKQIIYDNHFIEVNVGEIEGMHYTEIQKKFGEKYKKWRSVETKYENERFKGGESKKEVRLRVFEGLKKYVKDTKYQSIAISSHGIMLSQILIALGLNGSEIPNGAILCLAYSNEEWIVKGFI